METSPTPRPLRNGKPIDEVFIFLMKYYFYLGLVGYVPYFLIQSLQNAPDQTDKSIYCIIILIVVCELLILFGMDIFGMQSNFLDRISRLVPLIAILLGTAGVLYQAILIWSLGWEQGYSIITILGISNLLVFGILGWFFIRQEYGLTKTNLSPSLNDSMMCLLFIGILYFVEYFLTGAFLVGIIISFLAYPFIILIWGHPKVVPQVKPRKLVNRYERTTFSHYVVDVTKAGAVLVTIIIVLYDGSVILFPLAESETPLLWVRNLALVTLFAAFAMSVYNRFSDRLYGLFVVILLYILTFVHFFLVIALHVEVWWLIAPINGFTLAAIYFFIEEKGHKSNNVRVMSGSYYSLILSIIVVAIILRVNPETDQILDYGKLIVSVIGLAYLIGYIRQSPAAARVA